MTLAAEPAIDVTTVSDLLHELGDIPPSRVLLKPLPGTATVDDVLEVRRRTRRLCELVDGTLVEKGMGYKESLLAVVIIRLLETFVEARNLGLVTGADGMMRLFADLVRIPDVAYVSWARIPGGRVPVDPIPRLAPNLAVEVLSASNTAREMERKRGEYFRAGVELVWIFDPDPRTVDVYTSPDTFTRLTESETLDGGAVLPGFSIPLSQIFGVLDRRQDDK
ncbi:MAG TPA: Uma2 family endonuclease [Tepidisphaeraceae bacterium]|nr:Uma2 family endonuclease [Tepidisphaeraceae bacterium]